VILAQLPSYITDFFLVMVVVAFFSCGTAVQGAGARVAYALARDGALPASNWVKKVSPRFKDASERVLIGVIVPFLFMLLVLVNPSKPIHILWFYYPAKVNALYALVSFGVSGIYLSFFLTVLGSFIARQRGWKPSGSFTLGKWGVPVTVAGMVVLAGDVRQYLLAELSGERSRALQLRMDHLARYGDHCDNRRTVRGHHPPRPQDRHSPH